MNDPGEIVTTVASLVAASRVDEACRLLDSAVDEALQHGHPVIAAKLLVTAAGPLVQSGRPLWVVERIDCILEDLDPVTHPLTVGHLLSTRAGLLRGPRRYAEALQDQAEAIGLLEARVPDAALTTLRHDRAVLLAEVGDGEQAVSGLVAAREAFLGMRDRIGVAAADHNLGYVLHDLGALDDAIEYLTEARDIFLAIDMPEEAAACDQNLGVVFYDAGRLSEAGRRFAVAHRRFSESEAWISAAECDANLSTLLTAMGRSEDALRYRERAEAAGVGIPTAPGTSARMPALDVDGIDTGDQLSGTSGSASA